MIRVGIVGLGVISSTHLKVIRSLPYAKLTAACDIIPSKQASVPEAAFYTSIERMLEESPMDCLHVCLPHHLHVPVSLLAAKKGLNVFLEKPAALDSVELQTLIPLEEQHSIKLGVCLQNRYNNTTSALKEIISSRPTGDLLGCKATVTWSRSTEYYSKEPWRGLCSEAGGGVMLSQAIHTLDLLCYLFGDIEWVSGWRGNLLHEDIGVEDTAVAHIQFQSGTSGCFYGTVTHCFDSPVELEVVFRNDRFLLSNGRLIRYAEEGASCVAEDSSIDGSKSYYGSGHTLAITSFYRSILEKTDDYIHPQDTMEVMMLIDAVTKSALSGTRVYLHP